MRRTDEATTMGRHRWWRAAMQLALTLLMVAATLGSAARVGAQKATPVAEGVAVLSVREDYEFDLQDAPIPGVLATMNYAAFLPDGTLVFAPARAIIEGVAAVANGEAASLAERIDTSTLLPHAPDELVSAVIVSGSQLAGGDPAQVVLPEGEATPDAGEIADAVGIDEGEALPPIVLALLGWTAGGPIERLSADEDEAATPLPQGVPEAQPVALLLMLTPAAAESAVPIIEERLETGTSLMTRQPYTDFFADWTITAISDEPVVVLDFTLAEAHRDILVQMLLRRDLVFLAW
jgi:hypothetical protein